MTSFRYAKTVTITIITITITTTTTITSTIIAVTVGQYHTKAIIAPIAIAVTTY